MNALAKAIALLVGLVISGRVLFAGIVVLACCLLGIAVEVAVPIAAVLAVAIIVGIVVTASKG